MKHRVILRVAFILILSALFILIQHQVLIQNNAIKNLNNSIIDQNVLFSKRLDEIERKTNLHDNLITDATQSIVDLETEANSQAWIISRYKDDERIIQKSYTLISAQTNIYERLAFFRNTVKSEGKYRIDVNYVEMLSDDKAKEAAIADGNPDAGSLSNNFYIQEKDKVIYQIVLDPETTMYRLDGALLIQSPLDSLLDDVKSEYDGLFHVYFVDGKVAYLEEQYRP